jgi:hypothetical protein
MVPVVLALRAQPKVFDVTLCSTGQHATMLDVALSAFGLKADIQLGVMRPGQSLVELTCARMDCTSSTRYGRSRIVQGMPTLSASCLWRRYMMNRSNAASRSATNSYRRTRSDFAVCRTNTSRFVARCTQPKFFYFFEPTAQA